MRFTPAPRPGAPVQTDGRPVTVLMAPGFIARKVIRPVFMFVFVCVLTLTFVPTFEISLVLEFLTSVTISFFALPIEMGNMTGFAIAMFAMPNGSSHEFVTTLSTGGSR